MIKVAFVRQYKTVPAGFSICVDSPNFVLDNVTFNAERLAALVEADVVEMVDTSAPAIAVDVCADCADNNEKFEPNFSSTNWSKIQSSIAQNKSKFTYNEDYYFYNVEENTWKKSKLLKSASHIGRILSGFALPANATATHKYNRLTNLNKVYDFGLNKEDIVDASGYTPRSMR